MQLILDFFASEIDELDEKNVRILILGEKDGLPEKQREALKEAEKPETPAETPAQTETPAPAETLS